MKNLAGLLIVIASAFFFANHLEAGYVSYWKPSVSDPNRSLESHEGEIVSWSWKSGVQIKDWSDKTHKVDRANVFQVYRGDGERSEELVAAIQNGDVAALKQISSQAENPLDREEALLEHARISHGNAAPKRALLIYQEYAANYPDGNFIDVAYTQLASLQRLTGQSEEALTTLNSLGKLGELQAATASADMGDIYVEMGKYDNALKAFQKAKPLAEKFLNPSIQMRSLGWGGEAARKLGQNELATQMFKDTFNVDVSRGFDALASTARGIAYKGLGDLAGDTEDAYTQYQLASYWLSGSPHEGQCVLRMMQIAQSLAATNADTQRWAENAKQLRILMQARWPKLLNDQK